MKRSLLFLALLGVTSFSASAKPLDIIVKCVIGSEKDALVIGPSRTPFNFAKTSPVRFATIWELPTLAGTPEEPSCPLVPYAIDRAEAGWELQCSADTVGDLIRLTGTFAFSAPEETRAVFGEQSGPIYKNNILLMANRSVTATMHSSTVPFQLNALPGKEYEVKIRKLNKWVRCRITCWYGK